MESEQFGALAGGVISRLVRHVERAAQKQDLSMAQYRVLGLLAEGEAASSRIAAKATVTRSSISSVVDALVARGLVERGAPAADRRHLPLAITPAGERVWAETNAAISQGLADILGELDDRRAGAVRKAFGHLRTALDRQRDRHLGGGAA